jgi:hypothetical protein
MMDMANRCPKKCLWVNLLIKGRRHQTETEGGDDMNMLEIEEIASVLDRAERERTRCHHSAKSIRCLGQPKRMLFKVPGST